MAAAHGRWRSECGFNGVGPPVFPPVKTARPTLPSSSFHFAFRFFLGTALFTVSLRDLFKKRRLVMAAKALRRCSSQRVRYHRGSWLQRRCFVIAGSTTAFAHTLLFFNGVKSEQKPGGAAGEDSMVRGIEASSEQSVVEVRLTC